MALLDAKRLMSNWKANRCFTIFMLPQMGDFTGSNRIGKLLVKLFSSYPLFSQAWNNAPCAL
jgi:hypothetical protein